mgnify:CR=1 FL=1
MIVSLASDNLKFNSIKLDFDDEGNLSDINNRSFYAKDTKATNINGLYDSYIRAIRWASDRIKDNGVIGFVTNANFVDSNTADGLRKCLVEEFSSLYIFHLRGNQRTSGERSRKEGGIRCRLREAG